VGYPATEVLTVNELILSLPLPPKEYCLNSRTHWAVKANVNNEAQAVAVACLLEGGWRPGSVCFNRPTATVLFHFPTRTIRDHDNFIPRMKPFWDALVAAEVLLKDDVDHLGWPIYSHVYDKPGRVVLTLRERV